LGNLQQQPKPHRKNRKREGVGGALTARESTNSGGGVKRGVCKIDEEKELELAGKPARPITMEAKLYAANTDSRKDNAKVRSSGYPRLGRRKKQSFLRGVSEGSSYRGKSMITGRGKKNAGGG